MNLANNLIDSAGKHGSRIAIKLDDVELTYAALDGGSARVAGLLRTKGLQAGDRVGIMLPNGPRLDYDEWAEGGAQGWSYDEVLPVFKRSECNDELDDEYTAQLGR